MAACVAAALLSACGSSSSPPALLPGETQSAASAYAAVTVSPLAGTPDASPATQISFLGAPGTHVSDVDAVFKKAVAAGAKGSRQPENMFYGDRIGSVTDRWGNTWSIATHIEDVAPEEMKRRMANMKHG